MRGHRADLPDLARNVAAQIGNAPDARRSARRRACASHATRMRRHASISTRVRRRAPPPPTRRSAVQLRMNVERRAREVAPLADERLARRTRHDDRRTTTCTASQRLISARRRWRSGRCRRSVGQPTRGQRWRARAGVRRRRATRHDRRASSSETSAAASAPASTSVTRMPVRSCCTTSGRPPESNATTGVSHSCASTATRPSPSSTDGTTSAAARR